MILSTSRYPSLILEFEVRKLSGYENKSDPESKRGFESENIKMNIFETGEWRLGFLIGTGELFAGRFPPGTKLTFEANFIRNFSGMTDFFQAVRLCIFWV